jgi:hypothetical protein
MIVCLVLLVLIMYVVIIPEYLPSVDIAVWNTTSTCSSSYQVLLIFSHSSSEPNRTVVIPDGIKKRCFTERIVFSFWPSLVLNTRLER